MKKTYWLIEDNADLSVTVESLQQAIDMIQPQFEADRRDGILIEEIQYTLTPVEMTEEEFGELPEYNG